MECGIMNMKKTSENKFISKKLNNSEFDYFLVAEVVDLNEIDDLPKANFLLTLSVVSPSQAGQENVKNAFKCIGVDELPNYPSHLLERQALALYDYGCMATIHSELGNNFNDLLKKARSKADLVERLLGFYLDKRQNYIGNSGWDFLRGKVGE